MARRLVKLDPLSTSPLFTLALAAWYSGRLEEAASAYKRILELVPENAAAHSLLGEVYLELSGPMEALAEIEQEKDLYWRLPGQAMAYHALGNKRESDALLDEFIAKYQAGGAYNIAQVFAFRGQVDQAFKWLEQAYIQHDGGLFLVKVDPLLRNLRQDPRYVSFLKKMNLPV
jgi:tetratricopeptide (TPR) repeat protein